MTIIEQFVKPKTEKGKKNNFFLVFIFGSGLVRNSFRNDLKGILVFFVLDIVHLITQ